MVAEIMWKREVKRNTWMQKYFKMSRAFKIPKDEVFVWLRSISGWAF